MFTGPLKGKSEPEKCSYLMLWVGEKGRNIFSTWTIDQNEAKKLETYYTRFETYVKPRSNIIYNRYKLQSRKQNEGETFEHFVTDLQVLVKDCEYADNENVVRDQIVFGIRNPKVREKLMSIGSTLTLALALDCVRNYEMSHTQARTINEASSGTAAYVNVIRKGNKSKHKRKEETRKEYAPKEKEILCSKCGYPSAHKSCPASGQTCKKCGRKNHFARKCRTPKMDKLHNKVHTVDQNEYTDVSDEETLFVGYLEVNTLTESGDQQWVETIEIGGSKITVQLDTGAQCNVIPLDMMKSMENVDMNLKPSTPMRSFSGHKIKPKGKVTLPCKHKDKMYRQDFQAVDQNVKPILGADACQAMGLVKRIHSVVSGSTNHIPDDIQKQYGHVFKGIGCMPGTYSIKVDPNVKPVIHPPRKIPIFLKERVKEELESMERQGIIVKQTEPTQWVNSMVTVTKPNGKIRICIDPSDLNQGIQREHYPMKTIDDIIAEIPNANVFSKLDARSGFWQLKLDAESTKLCTFNTPFGRYSFTRLQFGINSAPEVYQRAVSSMISDIEGCEAVVDDNLIWGESMAEHNEHFVKVLDRVQENNLKLSEDKCRFRQSSITYVGHVLSSEGVKPDEEKVRAVREMKRPMTKKELQTFLGFVQYMAKFIPNMSEISAPLRGLLKKEVEWCGEQTQEESFQKLKSMVTQAPVLKYYDPKKELTLTVDASSKGLGAAILQEGHPIAYASRAMTSAQQNYAQIEKETLAIAFGCSKFHQYIYGRRVHVESDDKPLQSIFRKPLMMAPPRLQRLLLTLQKYNLDVIFKPGKEMFIADTFSRAYLPDSADDLVPDLSVNVVSAYLPLSPEKYIEFQKETANDHELPILQDVVLEGWPSDKREVPQEARPYWPFRDEISCVDGLLFKNHKVIVPKSLREKMLALAHKSHLGIVKCKSMARDTPYWPGMSVEIENMIQKCSVCAEASRKNPKEPLKETEIPDRHFN
ncbi:uncharacterized protein K02A2.6-like [Ylistrum balloti]|uniref:uncharacterized protein K02A2.6-like n=1 Tax=Ylistrum balloti TaxID=509963 RepID=UPI002905D4CE|nr:uncharacterized protein K02A2.6-like [Ylistrum balloti]